MGCGPTAPVRPLTPEEKKQKEKRDFVAAVMMSGVLGFILLLGAGQMALQIHTYRQAAARPKQPWDIG